MRTVLCDYHICIRIICVADKGEALVHPKGHYIDTVCWFNRIKRRRDWRSPCPRQLQLLSQPGGAIAFCRINGLKLGYLLGALKLTHSDAIGSRDAQYGKEKGETRGRASVEFVPKCAILSKSVMPSVGFMRGGLLVQLKIVQDVSRDRADYLAAIFTTVLKYIIYG